MERRKKIEISKQIFDESIKLNLKAKHGGSLDEPIENLKSLLNLLESELNQKNLISKISVSQNM